MSAQANPNYRVEHVAEAPRGWRVRTKMMATHMLRIAFPPGARKKGSGKVIEIFHPANENPCAMRNPPGFDRFTRYSAPETGTLYDAIHPGSRVTIVDRYGQSRTGRAVMRGPGGWVLNMGGAHGTPGIATPENTTRVKNGNPWNPDIFAKHQIAIAKKTLRMPDEIVNVLGGMTKDQAREILRKHGIRMKENSRHNPAKKFDHRRTETRRDLARFVRQHPKASRKEVLSTFPGYRRSNPDATGEAAELYETFHGKSPREILEMQESDAQRKTYTALGDLVELKIDAPTGTMSIGFTGSDAVKVASAPGGRQLYLLGGNQNLDSQLERFGADAEKDFVLLGVAAQITYRARKAINDFQTVDYYHDLGEETGEPPVAFYDRIKRRIFLAGGRYRVEAPGIIN